MTNKMMEITCPECEGEGIVWVLDWLYWDGSQDEHEEICDECNGEGSLIVDAEDYYSDHPEEAQLGLCGGNPKTLEGRGAQQQARQGSNA